MTMICPSCKEATLISVSSTGLHTCSKCSLGWFPPEDFKPLKLSDLPQVSPGPEVKILGEDQEPEGPSANIGRCCPDDLPQLIFPTPPHVFTVRDDGGLDDSQDPGAKGDVNKPRVSEGTFAYWPRTLLALARISEKGTDQPGRDWGGHMKVPDGFIRYLNAHGRHTLASHLEEIDKQMNEPHVLLMAWNIMTACEHYLRDQEENNAPK